MSLPTLSTYGGRTLAKGYAGQIADQCPFTIRSRINESATAIDFGRAVARGASGGVIPVTANGNVVIGIAVREALMVADSSNNVTFAQYATVPYMTIGSIYAVAAENADDGDQVVAIVAAGADAGKLGSVSGGTIGTGRLEVKGAIWDGAVTAGEIGLIKIIGGELATLTS